MNTPASNRATPREWIGLAVLMLPCMVVVMDLTVLHLAIPTLTADLNPSPSELLWIVDIYGFLLAGLLVTMGTLGDRIGRRRLLLMGAAGFTAASLLAAFATSAGMLIAARALLGIAGATLAPSTLSLVRTLFPDPGQRTQAIALWSASFAAGSALGPMLGGFILEHFSWGTVFLVPLPVMALLLVVGPKLLPEYRDPNAGRLDLPSAALSLAAVLAIIEGLKLTAEAGLNPLPILLMVGGIALGVVFVRRQSRLKDPLVDLNLFRVPAFSATLIIFMLNACVMFTVSFFSAQYFQMVLGLKPLQAGLWSLPGALSVIAGTLFAPRLVQFARPTVVMVAGLVWCALGFGVMTQVSAGGLPVLVLGWVLTSLGSGPLVTLVADAIVGSAPPERAGSAASLSSTAAEFGGALGLAILGSIGVAVYRLAMAGAGPLGIPFETVHTAGATLGGAVAVAETLPSAMSESLLAVAHAAFTQAFVTNAVISAGLMLLAAGLLVAVDARRSERETVGVMRPNPLPGEIGD